ncbi:DUF2271 domain-containing protein [Glaciecola sp. 1036]|uniref:DUF2271 domain-containing protein n=1 Tax=Alteromonadaceae TaxID=72275 RepID=UPI003D0518B6
MLKRLLVATSLITFSLIQNVHALEQATEVHLQIELPRLQVAEYHKPYVAVWLENDKRQATQIEVWYDVAMDNEKGEEWLADLRQWWRRGGRNLELPVDGVSGATKGPGRHHVEANLGQMMGSLPPGKYKLRVEVAREVGGRELLDLEIALPLDTTLLPLSKEGSREISQITLTATAD